MVSNGFPNVTTSGQHCSPELLDRKKGLRFWCPCMEINVSVQYNGGLIPDIILLTRCGYIRKPFDTTVVLIWYYMVLEKLNKLYH